MRWRKATRNRRNTTSGEGRGHGRSAGFQPAVSQGFQPARRAHHLTRPKIRTVCRLEIGDTAGWKPALRRNWSDFVNQPDERNERLYQWPAESASFKLRFR